MQNAVIERIDLKAVIENMEKWLLTSGIQLPAGPEKGAVAGWLTDQGQPEYAYMEITGYYLSTMAFMAMRDESKRAEAIAAAQNALDWLNHYISRGDLPPTRKFLIESNQEDWRNAAVFAFDLGMVIRGLAATFEMLAGPEHNAVSGAFLDHLGRFVAEDYSLKSHHAEKLEIQLPVKWSTTHGPYHLKVVSGLLSVHPELLTDELRRCLEKVYATFSDYCDSAEIIEDLHPTLYYLEGMVAYSLYDYAPDVLDKMEKLFTLMMSYQCEDGAVPYNPSTAKTVLRADINAQALRIGAILKHYGYLQGPEWDVKLQSLCDALLRFVNEEGAVSFHPLDGQHPKHWNAWCTMFAHQALSFYDKILRGEALTREEMNIIV